MDLHDYKDVAENYDRYLEVMYEHDDHHEHFQEFYLDLARKYGSGGVVDVACGTGAVLLYLERTFRRRCAGWRPERLKPWACA